MRRITFLLLMIALGGRIAASGQNFETYVLAGKQPVHISIEHYQQRAGLTPVLLDFGTLQVTGFMDERGQVFSRPPSGSGAGRPMLTINTMASMMAIGHNSYAMVVYEVNAVRTRMRTITNTIGLQMNIDWEAEKGAVILGETRLPFFLQRRERTPGTETIVITGANVMTMSEWLKASDGRTLVEASPAYQGMACMRATASTRKAE